MPSPERRPRSRPPGGNLDLVRVVTLDLLGEQLAKNIEEHGFRVAFDDVPRPRFLLVSADAPDVARLIERVELDPGDIVIDVSNSWFRDSAARGSRLRERGVAYLDAGLAAGEGGVRRAPSFTVGGSSEAYATVLPLLDAISRGAVMYTGPEGSGHFVKAAHNGIEYATMQLIAEAYDVLRLSGVGDIAAIFERWNGTLDSYLLALTVRVLRSGRDLVPAPLAANTGALSVKAALELAVAVPAIAAAVDARFLSRAERGTAVAKLSGVEENDVREALHSALVCACSQGFSLVAAGVTVDAVEVARVWRRHSIIASSVIDAPPSLSGIRDLDALRRVVIAAQKSGLALPAMSASLVWYDALRAAPGREGLIAAQRDAFRAVS